MMSQCATWMQMRRIENQTKGKLTLQDNCNSTSPCRAIILQGQFTFCLIFKFSLTKKTSNLLFTLPLVVARSMLLVFAIFSAVLTILWTSANICALFYYVLVERVLTFPLSWQTGIFPLLSRSSYQRLCHRANPVARNCYRGSQCVCCG